MPPVDCQAGSIPAEAILVPRQAVSCLWATGAWDASGDVLLDATADERPEPLSRLDEGAEKLADPVLAVLELDVRLLPPAQSAQLAPGVPCTRDAVRYAVRSCAATVLAAAAAQWEPLVSLPPELLAVAALASEESQQSELQLGLLEAAQPADELAARSVQRAELSRRSLFAVPVAAREQ